MKIYHVENSADGATAGVFLDRKSAENAADHLNQVSIANSMEGFEASHWSVMPESVITGSDLQWRKIWRVQIVREVIFVDNNRAMKFTGKLNVEEKLLAELSLDHLRDTIMKPIIQEGRLVNGPHATLYGYDLDKLRAHSAELMMVWTQELSALESSN